jgi:hypothetical protein
MRLRSPSFPQGLEVSVPALHVDMDEPRLTMLPLGAERSAIRLLLHEHYSQEQYKHQQFLCSLQQRVTTESERI